MGTTLTGTKPKDTYDSLIKVGDNGPISGTAKTLSDGLGNDLPISVSTSNVGVGTATPAAYSKLQVKVGSDYNLAIGQDSGAVGIGAYNDAVNANQNLNITASNIIFSSGGERARITANGLTFNGDTAAANALDDYEEGTFTATLKGSTTDPTTPVTTTGRYTKIGNVVSYSVSFSNVNTTGASGIISVSGFPFTSNANQVSQGGVVAHSLLNLNGASFSIGFLGGGSTQVNILGTQSNGAWLDGLHNPVSSGWIFLSGTYLV